MTTAILFLITVSVLVLVPAVFYKSRKTFMLKFYIRMTDSSAARALYRRMLLLLLLAFHALYVSVRTREYGIIVSTLAFAVFFAFTDTGKWLTRLHDSRRSLAAVMTLTLVLAFVPHMYSLAATMGFILVGAVFYPSVKIISLWRSDNQRGMLRADPAMLVNAYF